MPITLRDITPANWQQCIGLEPAPAQAHRIASNLYSLAEAYVEPRLRPRAIYLGRRMIGFVMYEFDAENDCYWIPRFMIDARCQGRGYGKRALQAVIAALRDQRPDAPIMLSITPDNAIARHLYSSLGFVATGHRRHGEEVLRLG
ncbi:hypothetical protein PC39_05435 [Salinisphaera sp. PC39]|uniref:GNAT family N-acetyltransferase n=1 Tax=Salinisphaera sp. PC39 TaxID=1304156 RepID=UPI003341EBDD